MIETEIKPKTKPKQITAQTEEDLKARFGQSRNPVVKALLAARLEHLQKHGRYFTNDEVQTYLNRR